MPGVTIALRGMTHVYPDGTAALRGVDLRIEAGECVALLGANGAGKSTLLQHLNGLLLAATGEVRVDGHRVEADSLVRVRQLVGYVFQQAEDQLFMPTVADDVAFGPRNLGLSATEVDERVRQAQAAGSEPRDATFFELADDYVRLVTSAALEHVRRGAAPEGSFGAGLSDAEHEAWLRGALSPEAQRAIDATGLHERAVTHTLRIEP